jgi:hypothetical protein
MKSDGGVSNIFGFMFWWSQFQTVGHKVAVFTKNVVVSLSPLKLISVKDAKVTHHHSSFLHIVDVTAHLYILLQPFNVVGLATDIFIKETTYRQSRVY